MTEFFEDIVIGARRRIGSWLFTADDIVRFARQFDPQRFHLSEEEAAKTHFGRLCASGWHTGSAYMKVMVRDRQDAERARREKGEPVARMGGSPGFTDLQWLKPVFAGDTVTYFSTLTGKRLSASMPEWGIVSFLNEGFNQSDEKVFGFKGAVFIERRER